MQYTTHYDSPVGGLTLSSDGTHLTGLWMDGQKYFGSTLDQETQPMDAIPLFDTVRTWLDRYFAGKRPTPQELPLAPKGSPFRQQVWELLCAIPYGETTTYGALSKALSARLGRESMSAQAVGGAVGHNPIAIIIPCHRVVGATGSLTGYAGGLEKKVALLRHEGVDLSPLFLPKKGTAL